jgi:hypothetical protein
MLTTCIVAINAGGTETGALLEKYLVLIGLSRLLRTAVDLVHN